MRGYIGNAPPAITPVGVYSIDDLSHAPWGGIRPPADMLTGLLRWYDPWLQHEIFRTSSSTTCLDFSGNNTSLVQGSGGFTWSDHKITFNGSSNYAALYTGSLTALTFAGWARPTRTTWSTSSATDSMVLFGNASGALFYFPYNEYTTGKRDIKASADGSSQGNPVYYWEPDLSWHHIAMTSTGTNNKIYLDGAEILSWTETMTTSSLEYSLGRLERTSGSYYYWQGDVGGVALWSAAQSESVIRRHMRLTSPWR
jgi:hypothetical protein